MALLIEILGIACLGIMLQEFEYYQKLTHFLNMPDKPFRCTLCATFWYSLGFTVSIYGIVGIIYSAIAAVTAELLERKLWN